MAIIFIEPDPYGGAYVGFRSPRLARLVVAAMACQTEEQRQDYLTRGAYLRNVEELAGMIPARVLRDVAAGWNARVRMDAWTAAHFYGWDAHTAFEGGR